jgi:hypothetical protein
MHLHSNNLWLEENPGATTEFKHQHTCEPAVRRRLLTAGAQIQTQIGSCELYAEQSGTPWDFRREIRFSRMKNRNKKKIEKGGSLLCEFSFYQMFNFSRLSSGTGKISCLRLKYHRTQSISTITTIQFNYLFIYFFLNRPKANTK